MAERMVQANGVELCTEPFGDPADPPILLVMGVGASMLWWDEGFCRMLAERGRFVIRYDHRDAGRSATSPPRRPEYTGADLVADAVGVLDAYEIPAAHVVGVSAGGAFAQLLALGSPDRVLTITLISTSPATHVSVELPAASVSTISAPTLVIHGTSDPMFPPEHGRALAAEISGARLLLLEGAGHGVERHDWVAIVEAVVHQTKGD